MSAARRVGSVVPLAVLLVLWGTAFSLACRLTIDPPGRREGDFSSVAGELLGVSRVAFSDSFFNAADGYFHKGVGHVERKAITDDFIQRWRAALEPEGHVHASGEALCEIMPWLDFAIRADPHHVDAYLTAAYWLGVSGRPDLAERVLLLGQQSNPDDYRILLDRARMRFDERDDARSAALLDEGLRAWPSGLDARDRQALLDLAAMLSYRGFLHDLAGERDAALACFRKALEASPNNPGLEKRVAAMAAGHDLSDADRAVWSAALGRKHHCPREDGHDHDGDDDDDHHHHDCPGE